MRPNVLELCNTSFLFGLQKLSLSPAKGFCTHQFLCLHGLPFNLASFFVPNDCYLF